MYRVGMKRKQTIDSQEKEIEHTPTHKENSQKSKGQCNSWFFKDINVVIENIGYTKSQKTFEKRSYIVNVHNEQE
jgi:hypothetical protein